MFMKRNRNVGQRVVYSHILEGVRKDLQDHAGHEFELENKFHQVSNAQINSNFQRPISTLSLPVFCCRSWQLQCSDLKCLGVEGLRDVEVSS